MAVTIVDSRTTIDEADATTGWTASVGVSVFTSQPSPVELSGCLGQQVSNSTEYAYHTHGSTVDGSGTGYLVYMWLLAGGVMDTTSNGGVAALLGDGTNRVGFHVAGSDKASFRHSEGQIAWQCALIDTSNLPTDQTAYTGTTGNFDVSSVIDFGAGFKTIAKSVGGVQNTWHDVIRIGNYGINITDGTSADPGTFLDIAIDDADNADGKAYGMVHEVASGVFGVQGPLNFGNTGTSSCHFQTVNETLVFEDRNIATDKYYIAIKGNTTGQTRFHLGTKVGSYGGSNGCSLVVPAGVGASFIASDTNVDYLNLYGSTISGFDQGVQFGTSNSHEIFNCNFSGCAIIKPGRTHFRNNNISTAIDSRGAIQIDANSADRYGDLTITSVGSGHGLYITQTGTLSLDAWSFIGYGNSGTNDAAIFNDSGGAVSIIAVNGSSGLTFKDGTGASTVIENAVTLTVTVVDQTGTGIVGAQVSIETQATGTSLMNEDTIAGGIASENYNYVSDTDVIIRVRKSSTGTTRYVNNSATATITSNGLSVKITMRTDDIAST